jgi:hypothetical protein
VREVVLRCFLWDVPILTASHASYRTVNAQTRQSKENTGDYRREDYGQPSRSNIEKHNADRDAGRKNKNRVAMPGSFGNASSVKKKEKRLNVSDR